MPEEPERRKVQATLRQVERYREGLIRKYMKFSDQAEHWNDRAYRVSLEIEQVNLVLKTAKELGIIPPEWKKPGGNGLPTAGPTASPLTARAAEVPPLPRTPRATGGPSGHPRPPGRA